MTGRPGNLPRLVVTRGLISVILLFSSSSTWSSAAEPGVQDESRGDVAPLPVPAQPAFVKRGDIVDAESRHLDEDLQLHYAALLARVKRDAPDLVAELAAQSPKPDLSGYGILPRLMPEAPPPATRPRARARSARYSWPWTEQKIATAAADLDRDRRSLDAEESVAERERHAALADLVHRYHALVDSQRNISEHLRYNRLWQAEIAARRAAYDRNTRLHDLVLERQGIRDALAAENDDAFERALVSVSNIDSKKSRGELEPELSSREAADADEISRTIDEVSVPTFLRVDHPSPHRWIVRVPVFTDIDDESFLTDFRRAVEGIWHVRDGADDFSVVLSVTHVDASALYGAQPGCAGSKEPRCAAPKPGSPIDVVAHAGLFAPTGASLSTGAETTHVYRTTILLGPGEVRAHVLAHEFGHVLGFHDRYFRGYHDLGSDGFEVMEVVADPDDLMGNPDDGPVPRHYFETLVEEAAAAAARDAGKPSPQLTGSTAPR